MIATVEQFKEFLMVDTEDTTNDAFYTKLLGRSQAEIEKYIDYPIEQSTVTDEIHDCAKIIIPNQIPISDLTIKYITDFTTTPTSDETLTENEDYFDYGTYIIFETHTEGRKRIKLSYIGGYDSASVPQPLVDAVIKLAAYSLNLNKPLEPNTETDMRMPKEIKDIINPFRKIAL
ncbi:MAG: hypothetical protein GX452_13945 [Ignavibacteriales bacterium]|nr:hypothetical protein [Ignavibacteriales bacterium]